MRLGKMDQRITLQSRAGTADGAGGFTYGWSDFATVPTVWARVEPLTGRESDQEGGVAATLMYSFTIRTRTDVNEDDRIVWRGDHFNIRRVLREGPRPLHIEIEAERGIPDADDD
jgi:SPP1 family predicted phage head-tail adaptor